jgi:Peptidase M15
MTNAPTLISQHTAREILDHLGWNVGSDARFAQALKNFQQGWRLGPRLELSGHIDHRTSVALEMSQARHHDGRPDASEHYSFADFKCHCGQVKLSCEGIKVIRPLLVSLDRYVDTFNPSDRRIIDGYRCPDHNHDVGGSSQSQHLFGAAADVKQKVATQALVAARLFSGIGTNPANGMVDHVDRRDRSGHNFGGGTPTHPVTFDDKPR